jgi:hypothetical protein
MNNQLSWSLTDEVAPFFQHACISSLCTLIDEKASKGLKYNDLKEQLLTWIQSAVDLNNQAPQFDIYRRAYEFARYY